MSGSVGICQDLSGSVSICQDLSVSVRKDRICLEQEDPIEHWICKSPPYQGPTKSCTDEILFINVFLIWVPLPFL